MHKPTGCRSPEIRCCRRGRLSFRVALAKAAGSDRKSGGNSPLAEIRREICQPQADLLDRPPANLNLQNNLASVFSRRMAWPLWHLACAAQTSPSGSLRDGKKAKEKRNASQD